MRTNLVVVMDDISAIQVAKDTSLAMLLEGQRRGYRLWYLNETDLYISNGRACAGMREVEVRDDPADWYRLGQSADRPLGGDDRSEEHTSELQSRGHLVCRHLLEKTK